jgi:hypothetical protein
LPTYAQFRTWALAHGYTPETLAPHVQAGNPRKTAERILVHLEGTHWDAEPLPYPKLCALFEGAAPTPAPTPADVTVHRLPTPESIRREPPYLYVTLARHTPREAFKTLAHLTGAKYLSKDERGPREIRFPYDVLLRVGARDTLEVPIDVPRACPCGKPLNGRQQTCSARCRKRASRTNGPKRGARSVTPTKTPPREMSHFLEANRRPDGSVRDTFTEFPAPGLLGRMSADSRAFNERVRFKYPAEEI